jgi:hypothetical protein
MRTKNNWQIMIAIAVVCAVFFAGVTSAQAIMTNGTELNYFVAIGQLAFDYDRTSQYELVPILPDLNVDALFGGILYEFTIPNFYDPLPMKTIDVTITGANSGASGLEIASVIDIFGSDSPYGEVGQSMFVNGVFVSTAITSTQVSEHWEMFPNPDWEHVKIWVPDAFELQSIQIATQSVPLPAAIYLLGAGFVGLASLRRKFKK